MKLVVLLLFLVAISIGKPLKIVSESTEFENGTTWDLVTSEKPAVEQSKIGKISQSHPISAVDESFGFKTAEKPKYKQKDSGISFLGDAELNITLPNGKFILAINDPNVMEDNEQKATSFCFKAKTAVQPAGKSQCPSNYCEVQFAYGVIGGYIIFNAYLGNHWLGAHSSSASVYISPTQMFIVGKENEAVTVCQFDLKAGFLPVKLVNKGDRSVTLEGVEIHHGKKVDVNEPVMVGISVGICSAVVIILGLIFLIMYCVKKPKAETSDNKKEMKEKKSIVPVDQVATPQNRAAFKK